MTNLPSPASGGGAIRLYERRFERADLGRLRADLAGAARSAGLDPGRVMDFVLAAHELASNSVLHGGGRGRLRLWAEDDALVCEVSDSGLLADESVGTAPAVPTAEGGAGLGIVRRVSDAFAIGSGPQGGTVARMRVALGPVADRPGAQP